MAADTASPRQGKSALDAASQTIKSGAAASVLDEGTQELKRTSDSLNRIAGECMGVCSDTMAAAVESGTQTSQLMSELGKSYMDACSNTVATMTEIARESVTCRTPADVIALQKKSMEAFNSTIEASSKLYGQIFGAYSKALEPLIARAADAPERMFRAIAE